MYIHPTGTKKILKARYLLKKKQLSTIFNIITTFDDKINKNL